ncbi:MAG TPA: type II secretion system protein N [Candidatus Hydrogenedentes bacterium]|nr:type II secretion system protein N [Candidatus Hydrogenedentota bacterium]HQM50271.1 type II secretion system protein N [Candidatus Hydrogenedentota bacterium]
MLRGLLVRKIFVLLDLALVLLLLLVAYQAFSAIFQPQRAIETAVAPGSVPQLEVAKVGKGADYGVITENGLFGPASREKSLEPAAGETVSEPTTTVTKLPLKLLGTAATSSKDPLASAGIKNTQTNVEDTFYLGEPVLSDVILEEVHKREVVLLNKKENQREILSMDEKEETGAAPAAGVAGARTASGSFEEGSPVVVNRKEIMEVASDMTRLVTELKPQMKTGTDGKVRGITSPVLGKVPLAQKVGLADNDVITSINGISIDSQEKIVEIAEKFRDLSVFHLKVERNGKTITRTIKLE